jgi:hypothetical protein
VRIALALAVLAIALPTALLIHQRTASKTIFTPCTPSSSTDSGDCLPGAVSKSGWWGNPYNVGTVPTHPKWEDPAAIAVVLGGLAIGAAIIGTRRAAPPAAPQT